MRVAVSKILGARDPAGPDGPCVPGDSGWAGLEALHVAEETVGRLAPAGQVRFGLAKGLRTTLDALRPGLAGEGGVVPIGA
jgi:hypothetical protein